MAEKLKSILERAHWSSILRAAVFAAAWLFLPWWLFLLVAAYCYFFHFFQPWKTFVAFLCLLALTVAQSPSPLFALVFGVVFYYILLIKDLIVIDRRSAYEVLVLALSFFLIRDFFRGFHALNGNALFWSFGVAVAMGLLADSTMRFFADVLPSSSPISLPSSSGEADDLPSPSFPSDSPEIKISKGHFRSIATWLITLLSWQMVLVGLFLPLDFIYQSIVVFVAVTFFYELIVGYFSNDLSRGKIFVTAGIFFSIMVLLLASVSWRP